MSNLAIAPSLIGKKAHTKGSNDATATDEDTQSSDVLFGERVLHSGCEETDGSGQRGGLQGCRNGILGVIGVIFFVVVRHGVCADSRDGLLAV